MITMIKNFSKWKRVNKVLLVLTLSFLLLAPLSGYLFMEGRKTAQAESFGYSLRYDVSDNVYSLKADIMDILIKVAPCTCIIISGICGTILWCRKPNDNLEEK